MLEDITHNFFDIEKSSFDRSVKVKVSNKSTADNGERKDERANGQVARSFGYPAKKKAVLLVAPPIPVWEQSGRQSRGR